MKTILLGSATIYNLAETTKANRLNPCDFLMHLLTEIRKHIGNKEDSFFEDLLALSDAIPEACKKAKTVET